jgi:5-methylcytosine-specific restriction endonuclease McrA
MNDSTLKQMDKEELIQELSKYNWDRTNVELAIRADFKCEYCEKDMLKDMENYKLWQVDHIIPKSSGYSNCEEFENKAISCVQCNKDLKGKWNPAIDVGYDKTRKEYITTIKQHILKQRELKNIEVSKIRAIVENYMKTKKLKN